MNFIEEIQSMDHTKLVQTMEFGSAEPALMAAYYMMLALIAIIVIPACFLIAEWAIKRVCGEEFFTRWWGTIVRASLFVFVSAIIGVWI